MRRALARHLKEWTYALVAREISRLTRYADSVVHVDPLPSDTGLLLAALDAPAKYLATSEAAAGILRDEPGVAIALFNGNFNHSTDIQKLLETVRPHLSRHGRVVVVLYNAYLSWLFRIADWLRLRQGPELTTFVTRHGSHPACATGRIRAR